MPVGLQTTHGSLIICSAAVRVNHVGFLPPQTQYFHIRPSGCYPPSMATRYRLYLWIAPAMALGTIAIAVFILANPTILGAQITVTVTCCACLVALLTAIHATAGLRAFSLGFVITAVAYVILLTQLGEFKNSAQRSYLLTTRMLHAAYVPIGQPVSDGGWGGSRGFDPPVSRFMLIGQMLWTLLLGTLGGIFSSLIHWRFRPICQNETQAPDDDDTPR